MKVDPEISTRQKLIMTWVLFIAVMMLHLINYTMDAAVQDDFIRFKADPGPNGFDYAVVMFALQWLPPFLVMMFRNQFVAWFSIAMGCSTFLLFTAHHLNHVIKPGPYGIFHVTAYMQEFFALMCVVLAIKWIRELKKEAAAIEGEK